MKVSAVLRARSPAGSVCIALFRRSSRSSAVSGSRSPAGRSPWPEVVRGEVEALERAEPLKQVRGQRARELVAGEVEGRERAEAPERAPRQRREPVLAEVERGERRKPVEGARGDRGHAAPGEVERRERREVLEHPRGERRERVEPREIPLGDLREVGVAHRPAGPGPGRRHQRVSDRRRARADPRPRPRDPPVHQVVHLVGERGVRRKRLDPAPARDDRRPVGTPSAPALDAMPSVSRSAAATS